MARYLDESEKALWHKVAASIKPLHAAPSKTSIKTHPQKQLKQQPPSSVPIAKASKFDMGNNPTRDDLEKALSAPIKKTSYAPRKTNLVRPDQSIKGLDGHWDKRLNKGVIIPDISIDLHGAGLQSAYDRLDGALEQARAQKMRVILLVTGRQRNYDRASGEGRGGIRAVMSDWLSASRHSDNIVTVRNAHPRHGGAGALYIILRK